MMTRALLHQAASLVGLAATARRRFAGRPLVVCYHGVCRGNPDVPDLEGLHVPRGLFEKQMYLLLRHYRPVTLEQVRDHLRGDVVMPEGAVLVTFDDGYRNVVDNALPVLRRLGIPCAIFLTVGLVGSRRSIWTAELEWWHRTDPDLRDIKRRLKAMSQVERERVLRRLLPEDTSLPACDSALVTWDDIRPWLAAEVAVGSHGQSHEPLTTCDEVSLTQELEQSRARINIELGVTADALAYPNGDCSPEVIEAAAGCGYALAFTTVPRHLRESDSRMAIPRILVGRQDGVAVLASRLSGWLEWMRRG